MTHPIDHIRKYIPIPAELETSIRSQMQEHRFKRRQTISTLSVLRTNTFFILSGSARVFYTQGGKEYTCSFAFPDQFVTLSHRILNDPYSNITIEFMEPTKVVFIPRPDKNRARPELGLASELEIYSFIITALIEHCRQLEERVQIMQSASARERYDWLITRHPQVLEHATVTQIASYLGVTKETLYRIRAGRY